MRFLREYARVPFGSVSRSKDGSAAAEMTSGRRPLSHVPALEEVGIEFAIFE